MQIDALVDVDVATQPDVIRKAQAHPIFNGRKSVHVEDEAVEDGSKSDACHRRHPAYQGHDRLLQDVPRFARCLAVQVDRHATSCPIVGPVSGYFGGHLIGLWACHGIGAAALASW